MSRATDLAADLQRALAAKAKAREKAHLAGFGGNKHPETKREMSDEEARQALKNLALAAMGAKADRKSGNL